MALAMARPWKHPKTGVYYLRKRVPLDLVSVVGRQVEKSSLRTKDVHEARRLHAEALATLEARWRNLRVGLLRPTSRQIAALAGEFYRSMADDEGRARWSPFASPFRTKFAADRVDNWSDPIVREDFRAVFGPEIESLLRNHGISIHPDYIDEFELSVARAFRDGELKRVAIAVDGDYSPDPAGMRFPPMHETFQNGVPGNSVKNDVMRISEPFDAYATAAQIAASTRKRWGQALGHLPAHVGYDDLRKLTSDDVADWIAHLRKTGLSERTIRDVHLSALRALLGWLVEQRKLKTNPATGIRIRVPKTGVLRSKSYSDAEAALILKSALEPQSARLGDKHAAARRWVPWLCAYTGARVNELTQLRSEDVLEIDGIPTLRITPEAGSVKTKKFREVPLHPHLIEQGFLIFARKRKAGPLFYDPKPNSKAVTPVYKKMGERLAAWVRELGVTDTGVDPNHGWRHRFKTVGRRARLEADVLDAIQGHVPRTEGGAYGEFDIRTLYERSQSYLDTDGDGGRRNAE